MTKLFHLKPMEATHEDGIALIYVKSEKKWLPMYRAGMNNNEIFVQGRGWVNMKKWKNPKIVYVTPLESVTGKALKAVKDAYGYEAAMGMVHGYGVDCLYHDHSCGLSYAKLEFCNACDLGEFYDKYSDVLQEIGDKFVASLLDHGFYLQGTWLYYGDEAKKDTDDYGNIVGRTGIYEKIKLHPLQYVDHCIGSSAFLGRMLPVWNPMDFEQLLFSLFYAKYDLDDEDNYKAFTKRKESMSVLDQIADLTNDDVANSFEGIFEAEKEHITYEALTGKIK